VPKVVPVALGGRTWPSEKAAFRDVQRWVHAARDGAELPDEARRVLVDIAERVLGERVVAVEIRSDVARVGRRAAQPAPAPILARDIWAEWRERGVCAGDDGRELDWFSNDRRFAAPRGTRATLVRSGASA
jgi:hypothetical protein